MGTVHSLSLPSRLFEQKLGEPLLRVFVWLVLTQRTEQFRGITLEAKAHGNSDSSGSVFPTRQRRALPAFGDDIFVCTGRGVNLATYD